jgi:hypothetical protein
MTMLEVPRSLLSWAEEPMLTVGDILEVVLLCCIKNVGLKMELRVGDDLVPGSGGSQRADQCSGILPCRCLTARYFLWCETFDYICK